MKVAAILPAAGLGTRMGHDLGRKQFLLLDGVPVLLHTLRKFLACPLVTEIVVTVRPDDLDFAHEILAQETSSGKPVTIVSGGETRQQSVENGLRSLADDVEIVAVHDAVRPFIDIECIGRVIREAARHGGAIVGIVPVDTVKQVHLHSIRATIPRDRLVLAQTPQVFRRQLLVEAYEKANADQFTGTDESSLVERLEKIEVSVVAGSDRNIKITKPGDIKLAELFLAEERAAATAATSV